MKERHLIVGAHIHNRGENALKVQKLLTEYGCNIKTRLGLHEVAEDYCAPGGVLILEMTGDDAVCQELARLLGDIEGVEVQKMEFRH